MYDALDQFFTQHQGVLPAPGLYKRIMTEVERPLIFLTLRAVSGNQQKAAFILGMNRNTLRKKLKILMKNRETRMALRQFAEVVQEDLF